MRVTRIIIASVLIIMLPFSFAISSKAAVCNQSPTGVHYIGHISQPYGYHVNAGTHSYLWGYGADGSKIYRNDCMLTEVYQYCRNQCVYCGQSDGSAEHSHYVKTMHSIAHN